MSVWFSWQGADLIIDIHVLPRAARDEITGISGGWLKVKISAPPVDGKANRHLIEFFAKTFQVAKRDVVLLTGESSRDKRFRIRSPKSVPGFIPAVARMD
jgi:uncharacterized protein (TIGR00251 family)